MAELTVEEVTVALDHLQHVRVSLLCEGSSSDSYKLKRTPVNLYSTFTVQSPDIITLSPIKLNIHPVVSVTLLVSESLSVGSFHPVNPVAIKVIDWACVFFDEVSQIQLVPAHCHADKTSGEVHLGEQVESHQGPLPPLEAWPICRYTFGCHWYVCNSSIFTSDP